MRGEGAGVLVRWAGGDRERAVLDFCVSSWFECVFEVLFVLHWVLTAVMCDISIIQVQYTVQG